MAGELLDNLWFAPLDGPAGAVPLRSVYAADAGAPIGDAQPFTIQLDAVRLAVRPGHDWFDRLTRRDRDVVVYSTTARGTNAPVTRVHYYQNNIDLEQVLAFHDMPSRTMHVCADYSGTEPVHLAIKVATPSNFGRKDQPVIQAVQGLLTSAQAFPAVAPFVPGAAASAEVAQSLVTLLDQEILPRALQMEEDIAFDPPGEERAKTLRAGRYVAFDRPVDGTSLTLADNGQVQGPGSEALSYAVFRIDARNTPDPDFVISQRMATLLSGLDAARSGDAPGAAQPAIDFLRDTMTAYSNFKALQRYHQLQAKPAAQRTDAEKALMATIEANDALKPFLKPPPAP